MHIIQQASEGKGVNVVFMGDGFSDRMISDGTYDKLMREAAEEFMKEEPYKSFRNCFNLSYVDLVSKNEICGKGETALSTWFGEGTRVGGNDVRAEIYAGNALSEIGSGKIEETLIVVLVNYDGYYGTCYMYDPGSDKDYGNGYSVAFVTTGASNTERWNVLRHETGHGFAKLADEYSNGNGTVDPEFIKSYRAMEPNGWWKNIDFTSDPSSVKWSQFLSDSRYSAEPLGVFEGGCTYDYGVFRPTENSIMNNNTGGFNAPSRYAIWYRINKLAYGDEWAGTYEDFVAYDAVNFTPAAAQSRTRRNYVEKALPPLAPPVVIRRPAMASSQRAQSSPVAFPK